MKKFILSVLVLFIVVVILDRGISFVLNAVVEQSNFRYVRVSKIKSNDFIIIGNSRGVNSVNEKYSSNVLGKKVINLSYNGLTPKIITDLILDLGNKEIFENSKFVVELSSFLGWAEIDNTESCESSLTYKENDEVPNILLPFRKHFPSINQTYKELFPLNEFLHLLNYNNEGFLRSLYYLYSSDNEWINNKTIDDSLIQYYSNLKCVEISFDEKNFERFLNSVIENKINIIFYVAPWHPAYNEKFVNYETILDLIKTKYEVNVIRLDNLILDGNFFADGIHTNIEGSEFLSKELFNEIIKI